MTDSGGVFVVGQAAGDVELPHVKHGSEIVQFHRSNSTGIASPDFRIVSLSVVEWLKNVARLPMLVKHSIKTQTGELIE